MIKKPRTIGYLRVSTLEQSKEGVSLANQAHKIKAFAELKDLDLIELISDEARSGKDLKRPGIQKLIRLIEEGKIDSIVCYKLDRLTRRTKDLLYLVEDVFLKNNISFYSLNENIDTSNAMGKFFLTLMAGMAQMERDLISERTKDALGELSRQKRRLGSPDKVPFGFRQIKRKKASVADLVEIPQEIETVREIFSLRLQKQSLSKIGEKFKMAKSTIKYILDNPIYKENSILAVQ